MGARSIQAVVYFSLIRQPSRRRAAWYMPLYAAHMNSLSTPSLMHWWTRLSLMLPEQILNGSFIAFLSFGGTIGLCDLGGNTDHGDYHFLRHARRHRLYLPRRGPEGVVVGTTKKLCMHLHSARIEGFYCTACKYLKCSASLPFYPPQLSSKALNA